MKDVLNLSEIYVYPYSLALWSLTTGKAKTENIRLLKSRLVSTMKN